MRSKYKVEYNPPKCTRSTMKALAKGKSDWFIKQVDLGDCICITSCLNDLRSMDPLMSVQVLMYKEVFL